ncbi:MAG: transcriptional repressor [Calditrichota bacterium]
MTDFEIIKNLKASDIRPTNIRKEIYRIFMEAEFALSHNDLEILTGQKYDRVTIYRTLDLLCANSIIHRVIDDSGVSKYSLSKYEPPENPEVNKHLHFKCRKCGHTYCFSTIDLPEINFPAQLKVTSLDISAEGICHNCLGI